MFGQKKIHQRDSKSFEINSSEQEGVFQRRADNVTLSGFFAILANQQQISLRSLVPQNSKALADCSLDQLRLLSTPRESQLTAVYAPPSHWRRFSDIAPTGLTRSGDDTQGASARTSGDGLRQSKATSNA